MAEKMIPGVTYTVADYGAGRSLPPVPLIKNGLPPHPGTLLVSEMAKIAITPYRLAKLIGVQRSRLERIVAETHPVSPDTALRLAKYFGGPAERWLDMQTRYDLAVARKELEAELAKIHSIRG